MEPTPFIVSTSEDEIRRERQKARELRSSQWWKRRCSSGLCHYCGEKISPRFLTMDHIVPIVRGGKSTKGNVVPACKECNTVVLRSPDSCWNLSGTLETARPVHRSFKTPPGRPEGGWLWKNLRDL